MLLALLLQLVLPLPLLLLWATTGGVELQANPASPERGLGTVTWHAVLNAAAVAAAQLPSLSKDPIQLLSLSAGVAGSCKSSCTAAAAAAAAAISADCFTTLQQDL